MNNPLSNQEQIIRDIYKAIDKRLPQDIAATLDFKKPDYPSKGGSKICRGRILPKRTKTVFDASWCFYEIGVGRYDDSPGSAGGIGFMCFPDNKKCGQGAYTANINGLVTRYAESHPSFKASQRGLPAQYVFTYYPAMQSLDKPAEDLAELIAATLPHLLKLVVTK